MNMMQSFKMALSTIRINKVRSFLTMLGIIIGVTSVIALVSLMQGYNSDLTQYYEKQGVNKISVTATIYKASESVKLYDELYSYVKNNLASEAAGISPALTSSGTVSYGTNSEKTLTAYLGNEQFSKCNNYSLKSGREISYVDVENVNHVCVIGSYVAQKLFGYTDPVGETLYYKGIALKVIGIYYQKDGSTKSSMDDMIVMPYTLNKVVLNTVFISSYTVKAVDATVMTKLYTDLNSFLTNKVSSNLGTFKLTNENTALDTSNSQVASLSLVLAAVASIALLVGGIGIMNIMLVTVTERTREIGIRKAIGATRKAIITQFLIESGMLSAFGGIIGIILGFAITLVVGKAMFDLILLPSTFITIASFVFSIAIGIGFGLYPAIKASGLQPVVALRAD